MNAAQAALRRHVTGAIEAGKAEAVVEIPATHVKRDRLAAYVEDDLRRYCSWPEFRLEAGAVLRRERTLEDWADSRMLSVRAAQWCMNYLFGV